MAASNGGVVSNPITPVTANDIAVDDFVFGGGFAGLYAALHLSACGRRVLIADRAPELGGLLRSSYARLENGKALPFDLGTHYLLLSGDRTVDDVLLSVIDADDWVWFDRSLPEGHVFGGRVNPATGCLDVTGLAKHRTYAADFLLAPGDGDAAHTLDERWRRDFGDALLDDVLRPIGQKLAGCDPVQIAADGIDVFGPTRIKIVPGELSRLLKAAPVVDRRLAFASRDLGTSNIRKGYPKRGGIGVLCEHAAAVLERRGTQLLPSSNLIGFDMAGGQPVSARLQHHGRDVRVSFDRLVTALAPAPLAQALGVVVPSFPHASRDLSLFHFVADRPLPIDDLHWLTVWQPDLLSFRITLYDNIVPQFPDRPRLTVEVVHGRGALPADAAATVARELADIGVLAGGSVTLLAQETLPSALPLLAPGWRQRIGAQAASLAAQVPNLLPLGAATGNPFGQIKLMRSIYEALA